MAKEYGTKLTLKDNFSAVIQKAITATEKLKAQLEATEKKLNKMGSKEIKIGAKLDSSVNSSLNKLSDKIPKDKTIHIKAKDDLTRSVTNIKRDIYKMGRELQMGGMRDPFKGLNSSALRTASNFRMLRGVAQGVVGGHVMSQMAGTSLAASTAAGAAVGRVAGGVGRSTVLYNGKTAKRGSFDYYAGVETKHGKPTTDKSAYNMRFGGAGAGSYNPATGTYDALDRNYYKMVRYQRMQMRKFGDNAYLSKTKISMQKMDTGAGFFMRNQYSQKHLNGLEKWIYSTGSKLKNLSISINTTKATSAFKSFVNKISKKPIEIITRAKFALQRGRYSLSEMISGSHIKDGYYRIKMKLQDNASKGINNIWSKAKGLAGKTFSFSVKAITSGASKALSALMTSLKAISLAAGAIVIGGAVKAVTGAAQLESNAVSIKHFVKYSNQKDVAAGKAKALTDDEIAAKSDAYLGSMRKYAAETPFGDMDVMDAGRRAVTVMNGDLDQAKELVSIAGDMAALNPGKTIMDAMEALADLKTGEMERMKEFGLKISAEQFKGLVGKGKNDDLSEEEMNKAYKTLMDHKLKTMFGGGAKKLSGTLSGKWSTLTGTAGAGLADIGTMFAPGIKIGLDKAIAFISSAGPGFVNAFKPMADAFNNFMTGGAGGVGIFQPLIDAFGKIDFGAMIAGAIEVVKTSFKALVEFAEPVLATFGVIVADIMKGVSGELGDVGGVIDNLRRIWSESWPVLQDIMLTVWDVLKPVFGLLWNAIKVVIDLFTLAWPAISGAVEVVWAIIKPILEALAAVLNGVAWAADKVHDGLTYLINRNGSADEEVAENNEEAAGDGASERAVGMDYIPYNGFKVSAHRGEAILSRVEADNYRAGKTGSSSGVVINIHDPVVREEADLNRLGTMFANRLSEVRGNMGALGFA